MSKAYKKIEIVGVSEKSLSDAIDGAIEKASKTVHGLSWFEVSELRGSIEDGKVAEYQATVLIGFKLD
ncbi:MAG: dodecin family protein [Planctomycetota bacterium]|nr:dodecin family protein [Planctomycetota bacterium]